MIESQHPAHLVVGINVDGSFVAEMFQGQERTFFAIGDGNEALLRAIPLAMRQLAAERCAKNLASQS